MTTLSESKARRPRPSVGHTLPLAPPPPMSRGWRNAVWLATAAALVSSLLGAKFLLQAGADAAAAGQPGGQAGAAGGDGVICHGAYETQLPIAVLSPTVPGRIMRVLAVEGTDVKAGDDLLRVDDAAAAEAVAQANIALAAAKAQLRLAQHARDMHGRTIKEQEIAVESADAKWAAADQEAKGTDKVGAINETLKAAKYRLADAFKVGGKAERAKLETLKTMNPDLKVDEVTQAVEAAKAKVAQAERMLRECSVTAPEDGRVLRVGVAVGNVYGPQSRVAPILFLPKSARHVVRVEIEQETAHRVHKGDTAKLSDKFNANNTWVGTVDSVADAYLPRRAAADLMGMQADVKVLECIIVLGDNQAKALPKIGQPIRAEIQPPATK